MNKAEFLNALKKEISDLPFVEAEKTLVFYEESIDDRIEDGMSEEEAVAKIDDVKKIANEMRLELPISKLISNKVKESHNKASNKTLWMLLAICGLPFWLPLSIALVAVVLSIYISLWAIIISLYAIVISIGFVALAGLIAGSIRMFSTGILEGLLFVGMAICMAGLFFIAIKPTVWLTKKIIKLTLAFILKVKALFLSRGVSL